MDRELRFSDGLVVKLGLADYAQKALNNLLAKHPEVKDRAAPVRIRILTAGRHFDQAEAIIKDMPPDSIDTYKMILVLGDSYYMWGRPKEAKAAYDTFFKKFPNGPPAELTQFFSESAYRYAQMLIATGDEPGRSRATATCSWASSNRIFSGGSRPSWPSCS